MLTGNQCNIYRSTGTYAAPVFVAVPYVGDVTLNLSRAEGEVNTRNSDFKLTLATLVDASAEFEILWKPEDEGFLAFKNAFINNTPLELAILDGASDEAGSQGLHADFAVTQFNRVEALTEGVKASVSIKPTLTANDPEWLEIAAAATTTPAG